MQFWNNEKTEKSLSTLNMISKHVDFVLIGGWAVHMYTDIQRSEDVDLVIGYESLDYFRQFGLQDYSKLKMKYTVIDGTTVDLFIEEYSDSDLPMPANEIMKNYITLGGIRVAKKEILLLLKLWGYFRQDEVKHRKDVIDVVSLLFYGNIDLQTVKKYLEKYKIDRRKGPDAMLEYLDKGLPLYEFVTGDKEKYEKLRKEYKRKIKDLFD